MVRITENNDWVIFIILGSIGLLLVMLQYMQRRAGLLDFFLQDFENTSNITPSWLIVSSVHIILLSAFISAYIPVIPRSIEAFSILGYTLNKFGFTLLSVSVFYFVKVLLSTLYYYSIGHFEAWEKYHFVSSKFYLGVSILLIVANVVQYYLYANSLILLYFLIFFSGFVFIFKLLYFGFNRNNILPSRWYYKFLYICTLQFAPVLALCKLLFF